MRMGFRTGTVPMNGLHGPSGRISAALLTLVTVLVACAALPGTPATALPAAAFDADYLLIGEVHDNPVQHRLRLRWLESLAAHHRFAIALEQLDATNQAALDRVRAADAAAAGSASPEQRARSLAEAGGFDFRGWRWEYYRPVVEFALQHDLPLVAANFSRAQTVAVARGGAPADLLPDGWGVAEQRALEASVRDGHCGLLPESVIAPMAAAQRSRDVQLARAIVDAQRRSGLPVVLLAGNGHLRRDIGVPRYLAKLAPEGRVFSIGLLEADGAHGDDGDDDGAGTARARARRYDFAALTPSAAREDPCEALRAKMRHRPAFAPQ